MKPETVLITGAAGWLGRGLVRAVREGLEGCPGLNHQFAGARLVCLVPKGESESFGGEVTVIRGDLRRPEDCRRFCAEGRGAVLLHAAGVIHPRTIADFYAVNVQGTANLLEAAAGTGVRRVVAVSSNSVCGVNPHVDHLFDEQSPVRPYMHYGRSKARMERLVRGFQASERIETVIVRCPWFYGPNQPARQTLFFRMIRDGKAPVVGGGHNRRSMVYVDNLCQGLLLAASKPEAAGKVYWIADAVPYTMNQVVDTVEELLESEFGQRCARRRLRLPGLVSDVAYIVDRCLQAVGLYHQKIHVLSEMNKTIACSVAKAWQELGYRPQVELAEGMRRSLRCAFARETWS